jgi:hypothetical protein
MLGRGDEKLMALRISAGARLVSGVSFDPVLGPAPPQRLELEIRDALAALRKVSLLLKYFDAIEQAVEPRPAPEDAHLV